jgi:alpha-N-arabinofuranosidase
VARRLQHLDARAAARLDFRPERPGEEAGLALFMNEAHHYEIAIRKAPDPGAREVLLRRRIGDLQAVVAAEPLPGDGPVTLHVRVTATTARFGYAPDGGPERTLGGDASLRYLSTEVAGGFTGTFVGVYATGRGARCSVPADVDWFEYAPAG